MSGSHPFTFSRIAASGYDAAAFGAPAAAAVASDSNPSVASMDITGIAPSMARQARARSASSWSLSRVIAYSDTASVSAVRQMTSVSTTLMRSCTVCVAMLASLAAVPSPLVAPLATII